MSAPLGVSGVLTSSALSLEYGRQKENLELSLDVPSQFAFFSPPFRVFVLYPYVCFIANVQGFKLYLANQEKVICLIFLEAEVSCLNFFKKFIKIASMANAIHMEMSCTLPGFTRSGYLFFMKDYSAL